MSATKARASSSLGAEKEMPVDEKEDGGKKFFR